MIYHMITATTLGVGNCQKCFKFFTINQAVMLFTLQVQCQWHVERIRHIFFGIAKLFAQPSHRITIRTWSIFIKDIPFRKCTPSDFNHLLIVTASHPVVATTLLWLKAAYTLMDIMSS